MTQRKTPAPEDVVRTDTRMAGQVARYHTWPTITTQNIAEHSWDVFRIVCAIWDPKGEDLIPATVCRHIAFHDCGELRTGDLPYPIKRIYPPLKQMMDELEEESLRDQRLVVPAIDDTWKRRIKMAHTVEMLEFALHEMTLGNKYAAFVAQRMQDYLDDQITAMVEACGEDEEKQVLAAEESEAISLYVLARYERFHNIGQANFNVSAGIAHHTMVAEQTAKAMAAGAVTVTKAGVDELRPGTPEDGGQHGGGDAA